jgi:hypothetical protein
MKSCSEALVKGRADRHPTTGQVLRLFSLAERRQLRQSGRTMLHLDLSLTDLQRLVLAILGVPPSAFQTATPQPGNCAQMRLPTCGK